MNILVVSFSSACYVFDKCPSLPLVCHFSSKLFLGHPPCAGCWVCKSDCGRRAVMGHRSSLLRSVLALLKAPDCAPLHACLWPLGMGVLGVWLLAFEYGGRWMLSFIHSLIHSIPISWGYRHSVSASVPAVSRTNKYPCLPELFPSVGRK